MSNSPLVNHTRISPNSTNPRRDKIRKITIHHVAGNLSVEALGNIFASASRKASSNYGVDNQGRVGMYVEEKNRAWTSSNADNDNQAVTIEVANIGGAPDWKVSDVALEKTIELCVDICKRNGIEKLIYTGDASGTLTRHNMFTATTCPGPYLQSKFPYIADSLMGYYSFLFTFTFFFNPCSINHAFTDYISNQCGCCCYHCNNLFNGQVINTKSNHYCSDETN